jgi:hypothetical protein
MDCQVEGDFSDDSVRRPVTWDFSALGGTRTPNLLIRSQMLYPIELRALVGTRRDYRVDRSRRNQLTADPAGVAAPTSSSVSGRSSSSSSSSSWTLSPRTHTNTAPITSSPAPSSVA